MRFSVLLSLLFLAACLGPAQGEDITATAQHFSAADSPLEQVGQVRVLGVVKLEAGNSRFGGLSDMMMEGDILTAIGDRGDWVSFRLHIDDRGMPLSAGDLRVERLGGLSDDKSDSDAEGMTVLPEGVVVSFERHHRLLLYSDGLSKPPMPFPGPDAIKALPTNGGIEAVTRLADGRLLLVGEDADAKGHSPAWIGRPGAWQSLVIKRKGIFHPTSAITLPDGDVLLLERSFSLLGGIGARLVRIPPAQLRPGMVAQGEEIMRLGPPMLVDNYEAMAVIRSRRGEDVVYLLSDDNFNPLQATLLMAIILP